MLGFIDLEKVITTCPFGPIPVAPLLGVTERIVGGVVSSVAAVVKLLLNPVLEFPARSVTPLTDTLTVALPGKGVSGVNVTTAPFTTYVPARFAPLTLMRTVPVPTVSGFTVSLNVTTTVLPTATLVAAFAGLPTHRRRRGVGYRRAARGKAARERRAPGCPPDP